MSEDAFSLSIDPETETVQRTPTVNGPSDQRLSGRGTDTIREDVVADDGTAKTWYDATKAFEDYVVRQHAASQTWAETKGVQARSHRFTQGYASEKTGRIYGGLRHVHQNTPDVLDVQTVVLTRTAWPYDGNGRPAPPVEYLSGLAEARTPTMSKLRRTLDGAEDVHQWGRVTVREPHEGRRSGYPHAHDGIIVVTTQSPSETETMMRDVIDTYVDANPFARQCDHKDGAVTVMSRDEGDGSTVNADTIVESLGAELTMNLVGWAFDGPNPLDGVSDAQRRFATLLWATGKSSVTFGKTFRRWVKRSQHGHESDHDGDDEPTVPPTTDDPTPVERVEPKSCDVPFTYPEDRD